MTNVNPMKSYEPPKIPTLADAREAPELLKKTPARWQKKAAIAACAGIIGLSSLAAFSVGFSANAYANPPATQSASQEILLAPSSSEAMLAQLETTDLEIRAHWGGSGAGPFYVARFTEQEAFGFLRALLEEAGLNFAATAPGYTVEVFGRDFHNWGEGVEVQLMLFDEARRVGIVQGAAFSNEDVTRAFAEQNITAGVVSNPGETVFDGFSLRFDENVSDEEFDNFRDAAIAEGREPARQALIEQISQQAAEFIAFLEAEGLLAPPVIAPPASDEIRITINGQPLATEVPPIAIDGRTLVPMRTIFNALGFEVSWQRETGTILATRGGDIIQMYVDETEMLVNNEPIALDVPPIVQDGRTLVPIRAVSDATGATVHWDSPTRTVQITTH